jgi:acyl-CoA synthetase (AMP-forming)/AMP-acid ligase II
MCKRAASAARRCMASFISLVPDSARQSSSPSPTVLELIEAQRCADPSALALVHVDAGCPPVCMSYEQLLCQARRAAGSLRAHGGGGAGSRIALLCDEAPQLVVAFLAIAISAAVVVPIDPGAPHARMVSLLLDCGASLVLCDRAWMPAIASKLRDEGGTPTLSLPVVAVEDLASSSLGAAEDWPPPTGACECHLVYTSGSTGRPKAVLVDHTALHGYCLAKATAHGLERTSRVLLASAHTWDPCLGDLFSTLSAGAVLCTASRALIVHELGHTLQAAACTHVCATPSLWSLLSLSPAELPALRLIALGGEALPYALIAPWVHARPTALRVANTYGVT